MSGIRLDRLLTSTAVLLVLAAAAGSALADPATPDTTVTILAPGNTSAAAPSVGGKDALLERCATALRQQLSLGRTAAAIARIGDTVYAVIPGSADDAESLAALRRLLLTTRGSARPPSPEQVAIGMSGPVANFADLGQAREEADRVLQVLAGARSHDGCAEVGEVGLAVTMLRLAELESARSAGRHSVLDDIDDHDAAHAASYGQTLRVYLASFGDPTEASKTLGVHTNTLRYRLRRLNELFGLDVADPVT